MQITNKKVSSTSITISKSDPQDKDYVFAIGPITVPKGSQGSSFVRLTIGSGTVTLTTGHGLALNDYVDVQWSTGHQANVQVTAVSGNNISLGGGSITALGDGLPVSGTSIIVSKQVTIVRVSEMLSMCDFLAWQFAGVGSTDKCYLTPVNDPDYTSETPILATGPELVSYEGANIPADFGTLFPSSEGYNFSGLRVSNGSITADANFRLLIGDDQS